MTVSVDPVRLRSLVNAAVDRALAECGVPVPAPVRGSGAGVGSSGAPRPPLNVQGLARRLSVVSSFLARVEGCGVADLLQDAGSFDGENGPVAGLRSVAEYVRKPAWASTVLAKLVRRGVEHGVLVDESGVVSFHNRSGVRVATMDTQGRVVKVPVDMEPVENAPSAPPTPSAPTSSESVEVVGEEPEGAVGDGPVPF